MTHAQLSASVVVFLAMHARPQIAGPVDYGAVADRATWDWHPEKADAVYCMMASDPSFVYAIECGPEQPSLVFSIRRGDKTLYKWTGHGRSVFIVRSGVLYYAEFGPTDDGGMIFAVDLVKGVELWREKLAAAGFIDHSAPGLNSMTIEANDDVVTITGMETAGHYLEFKDIKTGKTIANRRFTKAEVEAATRDR